METEIDVTTPGKTTSLLFRTSWDNIIACVAAIFLRFISFRFPESFSSRLWIRFYGVRILGKNSTTHLDLNFLPH